MGMDMSAAIPRSVMLFEAAAAVLLSVFGAAAAVAAAEGAPDGCTRNCGNISIPFPFGVEPSCYVEAGFNLTCDRSHRPPKLFLGDGTVQVLGINVSDATVRIYAGFTYFPGTNGTGIIKIGPKPVIASTWSGALREGGPYTLAEQRNKLVAIGCNVQVLLLGDSSEAPLSTCVAVCTWRPDTNAWSYPWIGVCNGVSCCQSEIIQGRSSYKFNALRVSGGTGPNSSVVAWINESGDSFSADSLNEDDYQQPIPAVLDWRINHTTCHRNKSSTACRSSHSFCENSMQQDGTVKHGHLCRCDRGYQGNPYVAGGCVGNNEISMNANPRRHTHVMASAKTQKEDTSANAHLASEAMLLYQMDAKTLTSVLIPYSTHATGNATMCLELSIAHVRKEPMEIHLKKEDVDDLSQLVVVGVEMGEPTGTLLPDQLRKKQFIWLIQKSVTIFISSLVLQIGLGASGVTACLLMLALGGPVIIRRIKLQRLKEKFFKQNKGLLLQQLISRNANISERMIITLRELEKATNNFDRKLVIGGGGHGIVFKGCCLETEVPLLVYEFISNGTLCSHLHIEGPISLSWNDRMRIAVEVSRALSYLHSSASLPIFHRDIKSSNILLDDSLTAKVSDFGASRYVPIDHNGVTTAVQGTIGYLDPMYYTTGTLTDKSDVYSFGVVLVELLTRKKPFAYQSEYGDGLISHFVKLLFKGKLVDIIDPQVMEEQDGSVEEVAIIAAMCTKLKVEDRPTMREVEMSLENLLVKKVAEETSRQYTMEEEILLSARNVKCSEPWRSSGLMLRTLLLCERYASASSAGSTVVGHQEDPNAARTPPRPVNHRDVHLLHAAFPAAAAHAGTRFAYFPGNNDTFLGTKPIVAHTWSGALVESGPYTLAEGKNRLVAYGCNVQILLEGDPNRTTSTCSAFCNYDSDSRWWFTPPDDCSGVACCLANIMTARSSYVFKEVKMNGATGPDSASLAWIAETESDIFRMVMDVEGDEVPVLPALLDWRINHTTCHGNRSSAACRSGHSLCENITQQVDAVQVQLGHLCRCDPGYQGNPYVPDGCYDVNECESPKSYPCYGICTNTDGGYQCQCLQGYEGNASVPNGCKDIDECDNPNLHSCHGRCKNIPGSFQCQCHDGTYGDPYTKGGCSSHLALKIGLGVGGGIIFMIFALGAPFITRKMKLHKVKRRKERFFKQNHGLLLQQLTSQKSDIGGRMIITLQELEKATNNFDPSHEIGGGGHGVVYKGLLDLQVVAIKKSKIVVQREIDDFVNEVAILSQINHRNVVKLLGCCLETEVPLLVYEFISNGTLSHHLHVEGMVSLSWDDRLRIAIEISKAVAYLHSAASTPILHRDIKSSNILLDDNLTAKVSDFGASKYVPIDQTGVTTVVQGTIGYLDPMYYYTGRLTDKSDVFSFGVLLIELLTRKKPFMYRTDDGESLVLHFASLVGENRLADIIDPQIMKEEGEQVDEVAALAAKCTKLNGEDRPTMREIEMTLENLKIAKKHVYHDTTSGRECNRGQTVTQYLSCDGVTVETSRQYSIEEEMLLSARYPR
ncbi:hypothetical protein EJB05_48454, partial [Eragrostis curvula]